MGSSVEPTAQWQAPQESGVSQPPCLAPGLQEKWPGGFEPEVEDRHLRGVHLEPCTAQGGPYVEMVFTEQGGCHRRLCVPSSKFSDAFVQG